MRIIVTRVDAKRYSTVVERDDGVQLSVPGYGFMRALPHDLAHYVVESALRLERGFWGSVAKGAKLRGMHLLKGRQKPHADQRAKEIEKANALFLSEAERLVACFEAIIEEKLESNPHLALTRLQASSAIFGRNARTIPFSDVAVVCAAWSLMQEHWNALPVGMCIRIDWPASRTRVTA